MEFEIRKGVDVPPKNTGRKPLYPFAAMEVGDHFDVPVGEEEATTVQRRLGGAVSSRKRFNPQEEYVTRQADGGKIVRVWRVK